MHHVAVRILHPPTRKDAGELTQLVGRARSLAAVDLARRFEVAEAEDVAIVSDDDDGLTFGERLRKVVAALEPGSGLVALGSGSIPLATGTDLRALVEVARSGEPHALTNNRYSSDVVAIGDAAILASVPDLPADNLLPRWLTVAGIPVDELPGRARLAMDVDSPLDLELLRRDPACPNPLAELAKSEAHRLSRAADAFDALAALARDPAKELFVAGRLSATTLRDLEERTACRIRALVEERGLRASAALAGEREAYDDEDDEHGVGADGDDNRQRPPASLLGSLLDRDGPAAIGALVHGLADGAAIDTRVLMAHRHGADESAWPSPEDRYASDLLLADRVRDPWLQQLTLHAWSHAIPIALGGHSLVGPGLRLALGLDR